MRERGFYWRGNRRLESCNSGRKIFPRCLLPRHRKREGGGREEWKDESKRSSRRIDRRGIISSDLEENLIIILEEKRGAFVVPSCGGGVNNGAVVARHEWEFDDSTRSVFVRLESGQVRSMKGDRRFIKGSRFASANFQRASNKSGCNRENEAGNPRVVRG